MKDFILCILLVACLFSGLANIYMLEKRENGFKMLNAVRRLNKLAESLEMDYIGCPAKLEADRSAVGPYRSMLDEFIWDNEAKEALTHEFRIRTLRKDLKNIPLRLEQWRKISVCIKEFETYGSDFTYDSTFVVEEKEEPGGK
jgi:hypothetical protein